MIVAGAAALAKLAPALRDPQDSLLPNFADAPDVNFEIALAVLDQAIKEGVANVQVPAESRREWAKKKRWEAVYPEYDFDPSL